MNMALFTKLLSNVWHIKLWYVMSYNPYLCNCFIIYANLWAYINIQYQCNTLITNTVNYTYKCGYLHIQQWYWQHVHFQ